jgi:hypothetical protein
MNHYYLEKMMQMKQREMQQLASEGTSTHSLTKQKLVSYFKSLFTKRSKNQTDQVCCA